MNIIKKVKRQVGTTTRLIGDATWNNGLYIAATTGMFINATTMLKKDGYHASLHRVTTITKLLDNLPKDKSTPLYFDEGCDIEQIKELENQGYNVKDVVVADYSIGNKAKIFCDEFVFSSPVVPIPSMYAPQIKKVVYDIPNGTTIVYFADDTKEIARVIDGDTFDKETGVLQCVAKKMYGSRSRFLKDVVNKGVVIEKKENKKKYEEVVDTYLDMFLRGEICVRCKTEDDARKLLSLLHKHGYKWTTGTSLLRETCWEVYDYNTAYYMKDGLSYGRCSFFKEDKGLEVVDYQDFVKSN